MTSEDVLLSVPFVGLREVQHSGYSTIDDMRPGEEDVLMFSLQVHNVSKHFSGPKNAYLVLGRWSEGSPNVASIPRTAFHCAAFGAPGDVGSGPIHYQGEKGRFDTEDMSITEWSRGFRDKRVPDTRSVILARFR